MLEDKQIQVVKKENEVDFLSCPRRLVDAIPVWSEVFDAYQDVRNAHMEAARVNSVRKAYGLTAGGSMMRVACMPHSLYAGIVQVWPDFLKNRKEFYAWLDRHPEYRVGGNISLVRSA